MARIKKGIILAGGTGSRLYPLTIASNKQLLPIYDKPAIYYPLSILMLAGIREVLFISTPRDLPALKNLFGEGTQWGMQFSYEVQENPRGLPEAFIIGEEFIQEEPVAMILGDNFFHGHGLPELLQEADQTFSGGHIFTHKVEDPRQYGVVTLEDGKIKRIEEKPQTPSSNLAITGLYYFDESVTSRAKGLKLSSRGEFEITDLVASYHSEGALTMSQLGRGTVWFDVGNPKSLLETSQYVEVIQSRQGVSVASPEEVAWRQGFVGDEQIKELIQKLPKSQYRLSLERGIYG